MSLLYINENGAKVSTEGNRIKVNYRDGLERSLPIESVEGIILLGKAQLTTQSMEACLKNGIAVSFFSKGGRYFGRLMSTGHIKASLQRQQAAQYDTDFAVGLAKSIIKAKIHNQMVVMKRYAKSKGVTLHDEEFQLRNAQKKIDEISDISALIGYEGTAAKYYFRALSKCIREEFHFSGRNRRPPLDPFNSMISLGYSVLMNYIYSEVENKGLSPYFGFLHRDSENHPTLVSDMMEEWRAVIVDATVMSLINGNEIQRDCFYMDSDSGGCLITREGLNIFLKKLERKLQTEIRYLEYMDYPVNFRRAIGLQMGKLSEAIRNSDYEIYSPIRIR